MIKHQVLGIHNNSVRVDPNLIPSNIQGMWFCLGMQVSSTTFNKECQHLGLQELVFINSRSFRYNGFEINRV